MRNPEMRRPVGGAARVGVCVDEIDLGDPALWAARLEERQAAFAILRRERPVAWFSSQPPDARSEDDPGFWAVTKHADVLEVSRNPEVFSSGRGATSLRDLPPDSELDASFISMDDPRHARLRGIVARRFTPKLLQDAMDNVVTVADGVIDAMAEKGETDFVADVAAPFPLLVIMDMMGIPRSEYRTVLDASNTILAAGDRELVDGAGAASGLEAVMKAGLTLVDLMTGIAEHRRRQPGDDLTTALITTELEGDALTPRELGSFFILLVTAGNDTTRTALSHGLHYLTQHPDQRAIWQRDLDGVTPTAVEEVLRYAGPVVFMRRTVERNHVLGGQELPAGARVAMFYGSACRDEDVFDDVDAFDVRRDPNPHVAFGGPGPHFCLGAHLARRELRVMFRRLLNRLPDIHATGVPELLEPAGVPLVAGVKRLPVTFSPIKVA